MYKFIRGTELAYWWVNHKKTFKQETEGGYIWAPFFEIDGSNNQGYSNLAKCQKGDLVFSFAKGKIQKIGIVENSPINTNKPEDFGKEGESWSREGRLVPISWKPIAKPFTPSDYFEDFSSYLPDKYSPMYKSGGKMGQGNPKNYLSRISEECAQRLLKLIEENIDANVLPLIESIFDDVEEINILEDYEEVDNQNIPITEKIALRNSRRGQGLFRARVIEIEKCCRVTGLSNEKLLIASHIKSWKSSNNFERLDGSNGLLLSPHIDKLFDKYYISFNKDGSLLVKNKSAKEALKLWGITGVKILRPLSTKQELYMNLHRERLKA